MLRAFRKGWTRASKTARHGANTEGTAAVEFALLLPVMITLFFGVVESSLALLCRADVSLMAATAGDLISQTKQATKADIDNVYSAAGTLLYPYYDPSKTGSEKPTIRITSVIDDGSGATNGNHLSGKVAWTCTQNGNGTLPTAKAIGDTYPLPQPIMTDKGSVVIAEIAYNYSSPTTKVITGDIPFTNNFYAKPRRVLQIPAPTDGCP